MFFKRALRISDQPELLPPAHFMRADGAETVEDWIRGGEAWAMLLRAYGGLGHESWILELGAGCGRNAFALRHALSSKATFDGLEPSEEKFRFLDEAFSETHRNFRFKRASVRCPENPDASTPFERFTFPYPDRLCSLLFSSGTFRRALPEAFTQGLRESFRVLRPGGRALLAVHLLDNYDPRKRRPDGFDTPAFEFSKPYGPYADTVATSNKERGELAVAYRLEFIQKLAEEIGFTLPHAPLTGRWSGAKAFVADADILVLDKPETALTPMGMP